MTLAEKIGVVPIINGVGPATRLGGLNLSEEILAEMMDSALQSYRMEELHLELLITSLGSLKCLEVWLRVAQPLH